jgi:hypothetical protein
VNLMVVKAFKWNNNIGFTSEGGFAIRLTNKTGSASVKGTLVKADTATDMAFILTGVNEHETIGAVYEDGIADGSLCWVANGGIVEVLLKDTTASTRGNWAKTSDTAGRADITNATAPGGGVAQLDEHMQEIGHGIENVTSGTDKLAKIIMHFN